jgi:DNA-binding transcriptional ArsR family regulator
MNDMLNKEGVQVILSALGTEGALDTLLCVKERKWITASEVSELMSIHVATAVKRLSSLYDIGLLDRRIRKGKARSALEYTLISASFGLDIDLDELSRNPSGQGENIDLYIQLLKDMAMRFGKFLGRNTDEIIAEWIAKTEGSNKVLAGLNDKASKNHSQDEVIQAISIVMEMEAESFGELTVKSLGAASLEAIDGSHIIDKLPSKFFGETKNPEGFNKHPIQKIGGK